MFIEQGSRAAGAHGCSGCFNVVCLVVDHCAGSVSVLEEKVPPKPQRWSMPQVGCASALSGQVLLAGAQADIRIPWQELW